MDNFHAEHYEENVATETLPTSSPEADELTPGEKSALQLNLSILMKNDPSFLDYDQIADERFYHQSLQNILRVGEKALPFLQEELLKDRDSQKEYLFSEFTTAIGELSNLNIILKSLSDSVDYRYTLIPHNYITALRRIIAETRIEDSYDPALETIAFHLVRLLEESEQLDSNIVRRMYQTLATTGTETAAEYINSHDFEIPSIDEIRKYQSSVEEIPSSFFHRNNNWIDDLTAVGITNTLSISERQANSYTSTQNEYDLTFKNMTPEQEKELCEKVEEIVKEFMGNNYFIPAHQTVLTLHTLNTLSEVDGISKHDVLKELRALSELIKNEEVDAELTPDLPSIGVEVEVPRKFFPLQFDVTPLPYSYINDLLLNNGLNIFQDGIPLEFAFPPSYSAYTQCRILFELRKAGFVPTDKNFASMHINLGMKSSEMDYLNALSSTSGHWGLEVAKDISDLLTYAFVPHGRIKSRKNLESVHVDQAKKVSGSDLSPSEYFIRYEFRTPRVFGPNTYRLLHEIQELGEFITSEDPEVIELKEEFQKEIEALRNFYGLVKNAPEIAQYTASEKVRQAKALRDLELEHEQLETKDIDDMTEKDAKLKELKAQRQPNLIEDARYLMTNYFAEIRKIRERRLAEQSTPIAA